MMNSSFRFTISGALTLSVFALPVSAQDEGFAWENGTEVSFVTTSGNSSSTTLGLKSSLEGEGGPNTFNLTLGGIRASSRVTTRTAEGTPADFDIVETTTTVESAANYFARTRYDRDLGQTFAFGGAGWERNTFSGFNHRFSIVAGMGKTWFRSDEGRLKTDFGGTYTIQKDIRPDPDEGDQFVGVRASVAASRTLTETTELETELVVDENLNDARDLRLDWISSISVALMEGLAFKTSYQILFDNNPARIGVPLFDTGGTEIGEVLIESEELDTFLTLSLVIRL